MKKKTPMLLTTFINRFGRICGTFKGRGGKNPQSSMTSDQFAWKEKKTMPSTTYSKGPKKKGEEK